LANRSLCVNIEKIGKTRVRIPTWHYLIYHSILPRTDWVWLIALIIKNEER